MFHQLKNLLPKTINRKGLRKSVDGAHICQSFRTMLEAKWGSDIKNSIWPKSYKNNLLYIDTINSVWSNELYLYKEELIEEMRKKHPSNVIKNLVIKVGAPRED